VTPKAGAGEVRVYGRVLPEDTAYPERITPERPEPLPYTIAPGQRYALGDTVPAEHFHAEEFDGSDHTVVRGTTVYHEIQFEHRVAFVKASEVRVVGSQSNT
jgi:hypothetical protein